MGVDVLQMHWLMQVTGNAGAPPGAKPTTSYLPDGLHASLILLKIAVLCPHGPRCSSAVNILCFRCYDSFRYHPVHLQSKERQSKHDNTLIALQNHRFNPCIELKQGVQAVLLVNLDIKVGLVNGSQGVNWL